MSHEAPRPCDRCGVLKRGRVDTLCADCRLTLSDAENRLWKAQMVASVKNLKRLAA